ncbi:MAG: type II/IV secretion system protein [Candidatus Andersenbacteria bacterium]|nr:type II/IV secretion system protein [Candidatus Andersenbacteria bacterium]
MLKIPDSRLKAILMQDGLMAATEFDAIAEEALRLGQGVASALISRGVINDKYYNGLLARHFGVSIAGLESRVIDANVLKLFPEELARQKRVIIFGKESDGSASAAMEDPSDLVTLEFLERYLKSRVKPYLALESDLNKGFAMYSEASSVDYKKLLEEAVANSQRSRLKGEEAATELPIVSILDNIFSYALALGASDIHIEIFEDFLLVRYRIDGVLKEMFRISKEVHPAIVARMKLLGGLKIDEHSKPQDGRYRYKVGSDMLDIRISIMPTFYGEKVEMRLLPAAQRPLSLSELGMMEDMAKVMEENIRKSYGMVLVCGPTGSGKSTTLYSVLNILNHPEVNIVTVEDQIEYDIKFINQTQINPTSGITFAAGLRAILRQDPNVIMVGEIRDAETAEIAVQSALTGHLVLSSLHTNDAPTAIPRFIDLKIPPFLAAAVLNAIIAQRLVRKICSQCIYSYAPSEELTAAVASQVMTLKIMDTFKMPKFIYAGKGCQACGGSGYRGRVGIFEVLDVSEEVRKLIINPDFSLDRLQDLAKREGMVSMFEDGLRKVERGVTTIEELLRVIGE